MKKTFALFTLTASVLALANEKSFVEGYFNSEHKITDSANEFKIKKTGIKTVIHANKNLNFGINLEGEDIKIPFENYGNILNNSDIELEGDLHISPFENAKVGINSKTKFNFRNEKENYGKYVATTHKIYFDSKKVKAFAEISHNYDKNATKSLKFVALNTELNHNILSSKFNFKYQFNDTSKVKNLLTEDMITLESKDYIHSYEIDLKKTFFNDKLELSTGAFIQHHYDSEIQLGDKYAKLSLQNDDDYKEMLKNEEKAKKLLKEIEDERKKLSNVNKEIENLKNEIYSKADKTKKQEIDSQKKKIETTRKELEIKKKEELDALDERTNAQIDFLRKNINDNELENTLKEIDSQYYENEEHKLEEKSKKINKLYGDKNGTVENNKGQDKITQLIGKYEKAKKEKEAKSREFTGATSELEKKYKEIGKTLNNDYEQKIKKLNDELTEQDNKYNAKNAENSEKPELKAYQKGLAKLSSKAKSLVPMHNLYYGVKLGAKYMGIKNVTLAANGIFGGETGFVK